MTLRERLDNLEKKIDKRFYEMEKSFNKKMQPFHDFLVAQKAIQESRGDSSISIPKEAFKLILKLAAIAAAALGAYKIQ